MPAWKAFSRAIAPCLLLAAGCEVVPKMDQQVTMDAPAAARPPAGLDPAAQAAAADARKSEAERLVFHRRAEGALSRRAGRDAALEGRMVTVSFVDAPAADVARALIGDVLGAQVSVASGAEATITLVSPEPIEAADALAALETVLAESGLALTATRTGYLLAPLSEAGETSAQLARGPLGHGVDFAPVRYAAPSDIAEIIAPFLSDRVSVRADDARRALILRGPRSDMAAAREAIEIFDQPDLVDRNLGMFRLRYADAATIRTEIAALLDASAAQHSTELLALPRLNLLFVAAPTRAAFDEASRLIERLDQPSGGDERRLRYYPVRHVSAEQLAAQLGAAFGGERGSTAAARPLTEEPASAVQPGFRALPGSAAEIGGISIATDTINNALIIRATDQEYRETLELIERMDVLSPQVLIEATIAEVTLNDSLSFGVRWFFENAESTAGFSDLESGLVARVFPGFNYTFFDTDVRVALSALASVTEVSVLSAPSIMVLNNQTATLQVGDEVPIVTQQAQSVIDEGSPLVSTLQLRETGVILEVRPRINASDVVVLDIAQEVSDAVQTRTSGIDSPTIQQRKFTSTVAVGDNGTIALGGLIREVYTDNDSGVPMLSKIPVLGSAFKSRDVEKRRTELVVFLTPRIIRSDEDAREAVRYIRREMKRLGAGRS